SCISEPVSQSLTLCILHPPATTHTYSLSLHDALPISQTDVASNAVEGINSFDGDPVDNVLGLGALYPETIQIVTTDKSGIESVEDMEGKKVSVGAPGSGTYVNAEQILEVH